MTDGDRPGPAEFEPVKIGPRRRRIDPLAVGVIVVAFALTMAVVKPWSTAAPGVSVERSPTASIAGASVAPTDPGPSRWPDRGANIPPIWSDVVSVISDKVDWGIRTIVLATTADPASPAASPAAPFVQRYKEHWSPAQADGGADATAIVDQTDGQIIALGVTFPPIETPLDVRIWLDHEGGELEWMDARPVNDVPARGAYLFLRRGVEGAALRAWAPGRYRIDVLVAGGIRRIQTLIRDETGRVPDPGPWPVGDHSPSTMMPSMEGLPTGLFMLTTEAVTALRAEPGPKLDETSAWLDVDADAPVGGPRSFVARMYAPDVELVGVVLPAYAKIQSARIDRLVRLGESVPLIRQRVVWSDSSVAYVAFAPPTGAVWRPGVYALAVAWQDGDGSHAATWHLELRPGPLPATPLLLAATRSWAGYAGDHGVLLGVTEPLSGTDPLGIRLVDIVPQTKPGYPGLSGSDLIGCGETHVLGRPEVVGIVGSPDQGLTPVVVRILYPFPDQRRLEVLTASGSVPGLTLVLPVTTAEFGGPASYGFRAGSGPDAPGYTICIGLPAG